MIDRKLKRLKQRPEYNSDLFSQLASRPPKLALLPARTEYGYSPIDHVSGQAFTMGSGVTWGKDNEGIYLEFDGTSEAYLQLAGVSLQSLGDEAFTVVGEIQMDSPVSTEQILISQYRSDSEPDRGLSLGFLKSAGVGYQTLRYPSPNIGAGQLNAPALFPQEGVTSIFSSGFVPDYVPYATWPRGFDSSTASSSTGSYTIGYASPSVVVPTCPILIGAMWSNLTTRTMNFKGKIRWLVFFDSPFDYVKASVQVSQFGNMWADYTKRFVRRYPKVRVPRVWYYSKIGYQRAHRSNWEEATVYEEGSIAKTQGHTLVAIRGGVSGAVSPVVKVSSRYTSGSYYYNAFSGLSSFRGTPLYDGTVIWRVVSGTTKDTPIGSVAALNKMIHSGDTVRFDASENGFEGGDTLSLAGTAAGLERFFGSVTQRVVLDAWDFVKDTKGAQPPADVGVRSVSIGPMRASLSCPRQIYSANYAIDCGSSTDLILRGTSAFNLTGTSNARSFTSLWSSGKHGTNSTILGGATSLVVGGEFGYSSVYMSPVSLLGNKSLMYGSVFGEIVLPAGGYSPSAERGVRRMMASDTGLSATNCYIGMVGVTVPNRISEWNASGFYRAMLPGLDSSSMMGRTMPGCVDSVLGPSNGYTPSIYRVGGGTVKGTRMSVSYRTPGVSSLMAEREYGARYNRGSFVQFRVLIPTAGTRVLKIRGMAVRDVNSTWSEATKAQAWVQVSYYDVNGVKQSVTTMPDTLGMAANAHVVDGSTWQVPDSLTYTKVPFSLSVSLPNARSGVARVRVMYAHGYSEQDSYDTGQPYSNRVWIDPVVEIT